MLGAETEPAASVSPSSVALPLATPHVSADYASRGDSPARGAGLDPSGGPTHCDRGGTVTAASHRLHRSTSRLDDSCLDKLTRARPRVRQHVTHFQPTQFEDVRPHECTQTVAVTHRGGGA